MCRTRTADCGLTGTCCASFVFQSLRGMVLHPNKNQSNTTTRREVPFFAGWCWFSSYQRTRISCGGGWTIVCFAISYTIEGGHGNRNSPLPPALHSWLAGISEASSEHRRCVSYRNIDDCLSDASKVLRRQAVAVRQPSEFREQQPTMAVLHHNLTRRSLLSAQLPAINRRIRYRTLYM